MTDEAVKPGNQTSEYKLIKWLGLGSGLLVSVLTPLMAAGVLPANGTLAVIGGVVLSMAMSLSAYAKSRGEVKSQ